MRPNLDAHICHVWAEDVWTEAAPHEERVQTESAPAACTGYSKEGQLNVGVGLTSAFWLSACRCSRTSRISPAPFPPPNTPCIFNIAHRTGSAKGR